MATLSQVISDDAKAAWADALAFLKGLPADLMANGAGAQVTTNLEGALDSEVTTVAGPVAPLLVPYVNKGIDAAIADIDAEIAKLTDQKATLTAQKVPEA